MNNLFRVSTLALTLCQFSAMPYAAEAMTETELIEFLGEFDEDDELILDKVMADMGQTESNEDKQKQVEEVSNDQTSN